MYKELEEYFIDVDNLVNDFALNIAEEVATKRFYEMESVKAIAATRLNFALNELLALQSNGLTAEIDRIKLQLADKLIQGKTRSELCQKLSILKDRKREYNLALAAKKDKEDIKQFKLFVREKYGVEVWADFEEWRALKNDSI